jgi:hypothetical protein
MDSPVSSELQRRDERFEAPCEFQQIRFGLARVGAAEELWIFVRASFGVRRALSSSAASPPMSWIAIKTAA